MLMEMIGLDGESNGARFNVKSSMLFAVDSQQ